MNTKLKHAEAFCLMWYACRCGHRERIWNSRDGVTPFGLGCPSCGNISLYHIDFAQDAPARHHLLAPGQRFFRDGTPDDAVKFIERRIQMSKDSGRPIPKATAASLLKDAREQRGEWRKGWPMLERYEIGTFTLGKS